MALSISGTGASIPKLWVTIEEIRTLGWPWKYERH
jgi:hypothetical protein